jgi:nucleotide-binding universal stress UspA family protein
MNAHALARIRQPFVVVVGVDSSRGCEAAVEWVARRAIDEAHWRMHLLHVTTVRWSDDDTFRRLRAVRADFERVLPKLRPLGGDALLERVDFHQACVHDAASALVRLAADVDADMIVVGAEREESSALFERTARLAGCPVMLARAKAHTRRIHATH